MTEVRELLVPLDGTTDAMPALRVAASIAGMTGLAVSAMVVCSPNGDEASERAWLVERGEAVGIELRRSVVTPGLDVPGGVLAACEAGSLVCLSSHGRSGIAELVLGSDSNEIVRRTNGPVLLVGPEVRPLERFAKIMVCLDGSLVAERALEIAADLAASLQMSLLLVRVVDQDALLPSDLADDDELRQAVAHLTERGLTADWKLLFSTWPARALVVHANEAEVDLIVAGTHGRAGLRAVTMGSVANGIVRHAHQPVLVVHPEVRSPA
jgi:nucleotide-binding universal stress UspA family protein